MGTAEFACPSLEALAANRSHSIAGVVTQPDRPRGRELKPSPSPVKLVSLKHHFTIHQPQRVREPAFVETLRYLKPDLIVVIAYGQILPRGVLELPRHGCVNVHGSLLPKYRGASPIQSAILHGETETGVTTMFMDEGMDTGDIILQETIPIEPGDTAKTLHDRLAPLGAELLLKTIAFIGRDIAPRHPQDSTQASVCKRLTKEDGRIDWTLPARELHNRVRAFNPWPSAFTDLDTPRGRKMLKVWSASLTADRAHPPGTVVQIGADGIVVATGDGGLALQEVQLEGGRRQSAGEFLRGHDVQVGTVFR